MLNLHLEIVQLGLQLGIMYKLTSLTYTSTWQSKRQLRLRARQRSGGTGLDRAGRSGGRLLKGRPLSLKPVGVALRSVPLPPLSQAPHTIALGTLEARVVAHVSRQIVNRSPMPLARSLKTIVTLWPCTSCSTTSYGPTVA